MFKNSPHTQNAKSKIADYRKALATLGIAASMAYMSPVMTNLSEVHASGGSGGGGFFFGGGSGGGSGGDGGLRGGWGSGAGSFIINDPVTAKECGDCHEAYAPEALSQGAWKLMMGNLSDHFGENAALDEPTRKHIEDYLVAGAQPGNGPMRITELGWFVSEHRGKRLGNAMSWANCQYCHGGNRQMRR